MKIAMLSSYFYPHTGGTEKYVRDLSTALIKRGHAVTVFCYNTEKALSEEILDGIKIKRLPSLDLPWLLMPLALPLGLKQLEPFDVIHTHCPPVTFTTRIDKRLPKPHVVTYHCDITGFARFAGVIPVPGWINQIVEALGNSASARALKKVDAIITTSESYAQTSPVAKLFPHHAIPIGIYHNKIDESRRRQNLTENDREKYQALFVGRLAANKGVDYLVKAIPKILAKFPSAKFLIAGEGEEKVAIVNLLKQLNIEKAVAFYGKLTLDELVRLYSTSSVFVLPSINRLEAFGIVQLEAMACQTPVIASDIPGVNSVMEEGKSGYLVPKQDPDKLAEAIIKIFADPARAREMGKRARELVEEKYDWGIIGGQVENLYRTLLKT